MRRPYGFVAIKRCFAPKGISARGFRGTDRDARPRLAVLQALPKMH